MQRGSHPNRAGSEARCRRRELRWTAPVLALGLHAASVSPAAAGLTEPEGFRSSQWGVAPGLRAAPDLEDLDEADAVDLATRFREAYDALNRGDDQRAAELFEELGEHTGLLECWWNAALARMDLGEYSAALRHLETVDKGAPGELWLRLLRGVLLVATGRCEQALGDLSAALADRGVAEDPEARVSLLATMTSAERLLGHPDTAHKYLEEMKKIVGGLGQKELRAGVALQEGYLLSSQGDWEGAEKCFQAARRSSGQERARGDEREADMSLARHALARGDEASARRLLARALDGADEEKNRSTLGGILLDAPQIQEELGMEQDARRYLDRAGAMYEAAGLEVGRADVLLTRGQWRIESGEREDGIRDLRAARELYRRAQVPLALAHVELALAFAGQEEPQWAESLELAERAASVFATAKNPAGEGEARQLAAHLLLRLERTEDAVAAARRAWELGRKADDLGVQASAGTQLVQALALLDREAEAEAALAGLAGLGRSARVEEALAWASYHLAYNHYEAERWEDCAAGARESIDHTRRAGADADAARAAAEGLAVDALRRLRRWDEAESLAKDAGRDDLVKDVREAREDERRFQAEKAVYDAQLAESARRNAQVDRFNELVGVFNAHDWKHAADLAEGLAADPALDADLRVQTRLCLLEASINVGWDAWDRKELELAQREFRRSEALAAELSEPERRATALAGMASVAHAQEDHAAAASWDRAAGEAWLAVGQKEQAGRAFAEAARALHSSEPEEASRLYSRAIELLPANADTARLRAACWYNLGLLKDDAGDLAGAQDAFQASLAAALESGDPGAISRATAALGRNQ
jgi:hypothetical protein